MTAVVPAGLPNIKGNTGYLYYPSNVGYTVSDAFYKGKNGTSVNAYGTTYNEPVLSFDASRSNSIYGKSETVQPPTISLLPQIKF